MDIYSFKKRITSVDTDFNEECKLSSLFLLFQEAAGQHAEILDIGGDNTIKKGLHWVITRFYVEISRIPVDQEEVTVMTYPSDDNGLFFYRHFRILDNSNNVLVKASSVWVILDEFTHSIKRNPFNDKILPKVHLDDELPIPAKAIGEANIFSYERYIKYSDIDLNKHLNNTRYIELISDAFPLDFYKSHSIKSILINYLAEFIAGDKVSIYTSNQSPFTIIGKKDDKSHFIANLTFIDR